MLLGWSRLVAGHVRDSRVGRDVFVGLTAGMLWVLVELGRRLLPQVLGYTAMVPRGGGELNFAGAPCDVCNALSSWSVLLIRQLQPAFLTALLFVFLRLITKRQSIAIALGMIGIFIWWLNLAAATAPWIEIAAESIVVCLFTFVIIRFGVLAALVTLFVFSVCQIAPLTTEITHWSATLSNLTMALLAGLGVFAFVASRTGQPLFGRMDA